MLDFLLKWQTYRALKSGLLVDYYIKRVFFYLVKIGHKGLALFFTDKYLIEEISKWWLIFNLVVSRQSTQTQRNSALLVISLYISIILSVVFYLSFKSFCTIIKTIIVRNLML